MAEQKQLKKLIIMGAAGRDFHDFNVYWKNRDDYRLVAFTAAQIPDIAGRIYPPELCGEKYPDGIQIRAESELCELISSLDVSEVTLAYSDLNHIEVMHKAALVNAAGADFKLMGWKNTMLSSTKPVIAICAIRTGCGKSQTTRKVSQYLKELGKRVAVIRHPMPYGDLRAQICQRFASLDDLDKYNCTIEEREEYEPHIVSGNLLFAGVDYAEILKKAEAEADILLWDGGNNDLPFFKPDLHIVVCDPHRAGHELSYHPGETNLRMAHLVIVNKVDTASPEAVALVERNIRSANPNAAIIRANSPVNVVNAERITGKRVLIVEDGPTLTHGDMAIGAAHVAARKLGAAEIVDPRPYACGSLKSVFEHYRHITEVLPAMGYGREQMKDLQETINQVPCDLVLIGTPVDLSRILKIKKESLRVQYDLKEENPEVLKDAVKKVALM